MGDWHQQYLDNLEKKLLDNPQLTEKYEIRNSNMKRLYLPYWKGIRRNEILSNPDMLLINRKDQTPEYIIELEYSINYKKLLGIALLTDMAVLRLKSKVEIEMRPALFLITRQEFPNSEFIEREIESYTKSMDFKLFLANTFSSSIIM